MTPDGSHLHPAHRLPDVLARFDVGARDHEAAIRRDDFARNRRRLLIDAHADAQQDDKRRADDQRERDPFQLHRDGQSVRRFDSCTCIEVHTQPSSTSLPS
jgi:hypothetical protein